MTKLAHVFLVLLVVLLLLALRGCGGVRAGTYNIRRFGVEPTDLPRLAAIVEESGADVLALQEIEAEAAPRALAARLSRRGRSFVVALSTCGGKSGMRVGSLYDEARVRLVGTREFRTAGQREQRIRDLELEPVHQAHHKADGQFGHHFPLVVDLLAEAVPCQSGLVQQ